MRTVLIVGAGATRAEALARGAKVTQRPPLDTDFFQISGHHSVDAHRNRVAQFLKEHFGLQVDRNPRPGMEEIFGLVFSSTLGAPVPPGATEAFNSLCRVYATVIARTTNWLTPTSLGPLYRLVLALSKGDSFTVLTFNQDILVEKVLRLMTQSKHDVTWYPENGYALDFASITSPRGVSGGSLFDRDPNPGGTSTPLVLKPHGSLNWFAKTLRQDAVLSNLRRGQGIHCTRRMAINTDMTFTKPNASGKGRKKWYTWPIIIPPIVEKGTFLSAAVSPVWTQAWDALAAAERIVIYGYSFPNADAQTRAFFLRTAAARSRSPVLISINPDVGAAQRAHTVFRPSVHAVADSVKALLLRSQSVSL